MAQLSITIRVITQDQTIRTEMLAYYMGRLNGEYLGRVEFVDGVFRFSPKNHNLDGKIFHYLKMGYIVIENIYKIGAKIELPLSWLDEVYKTIPATDESEEVVIYNRDHYSHLANETSCIVTLSNEFCPTDLMVFVDEKPTNVYFGIEILEQYKTEEI
jgi:hypothetical protein